MIGKGMCMAKGVDMCGKGGHAWWRWHVWHAWQGACMVGGVHGREHAWQGACMAGGMHGRGHAWQGACMAGGVCVEVFKVNFA